MADMRKRCRQLRREATRPERLLWSLLRGKRCHGLRFRRQHPIGPYIVDFACPAVMLVIEIDGRTHDHREEHDADRSDFLRRRGWAVIRFGNAEVLEDPQAVVEAIVRTIEAEGMGSTGSGSA